jgi:hypothetical protein
MRTTPHDTVNSRFYAPLEMALAESTYTRICPDFPDGEFLAAGVGRVIDDAFTGRAWVQKLQQLVSMRLSVSNFFKTLGSQRRLEMLGEVAAHVRRQVDRAAGAHDPLAVHPELDGFAAYGADGHYEAHAAHAPLFEGKALVPGALYALNLRSHSLGLLDVTRPRRKKEHEILALKRLGSTALRMGEPTGTKVILVYDKAAIDYQEWLKWKAKGLYVISCEKSNSAADTVGINRWDAQDKRNIGIEADELVGVFCGALLRRITYRDPADDKLYVFMTSEMTLPPGLIAFLYKMRWDIEKVFDEKKNKLHEKKAWATSPTARSQQAHFTALAHNLMVLLELHLADEEGIVDEKTESKRRERIRLTNESIRQRGLRPNPLVANLSRTTQRSLQFIRWLRCHIFGETPYAKAIEILRPYMKAYIT